MKRKTLIRLKDDPQLRMLLKQSQHLFSRIMLTELLWPEAAAVLNRPQFRAFISSCLEYASIEDAAKALYFCEQNVFEAEEIIRHAPRLCLLWDLLDSFRGLLNLDWFRRAGQPRLFNTALRKTLEQIRDLVRTIYGVANHRRSMHEDRDRRIWQLKRMHPKWTWKQLGLHFGLNSGAVELAYEREARRAKQRLYGLHDIALLLLSTNERVATEGDELSLLATGVSVDKIKRETLIRLRDNPQRQALLEEPEFLSSGPLLTKVIRETLADRYQVVNRPELRTFITSGLEYESIEDFAQSFDVDMQRIVEAEQILGRTQRLYGVAVGDL